MGIRDWGLGTGDWENCSGIQTTTLPKFSSRSVRTRRKLFLVPSPQSPVPSPQSPVPERHS
ncbi:MAG: hypothetical protein V7L11_10045 [Nostoc sp.]|uniref:hypothetical protein n=1 Tax=Nostoc sp. TaxID=1180 RepID=UPI002FF88983